MISNSVSVCAFAQASFAKALSEASNGNTPGTQLDYLARYADRLLAKAVVREDVYVDRHYMDEFAAYYGRMLEPPKHTVRRFHLFKRDLDDAALSALFDQALSSEQEARQIEKDLSEDYLGFVSVRPIPAAPVGRTVLRALDEPGAQRHIWALSTHDVHLCNLKLRVEGLAFEQQDLAVGACATTALWSALSRVAKHEGIRAPTPAEVSAAAGRNGLPHGRTMPATAGLTVGQLCDATRAFGFAPEVLQATIPEVFLLGVHTYLQSGIPVVLGLWSEERGGHAVTAVGFQAEDPPNPMLHTSFEVRSASIKKFYVHDDRIGPYARTYVLYRPNASGEAEDTVDEALLLVVDGEVWTITSCVAPVYPKLRLPIRSLVALAERMGHSLEAIIEASGDGRVRVDFYYLRSGEYLRSLSGEVAGSGTAFLRRVLLPRWCAIIRWWAGDTCVAEFVYDTTDILRDESSEGRELLRAVVCRAPKYAADIRQLAEVLGVPSLPDQLPFVTGSVS